MNVFIQNQADQFHWWHIDNDEAKNFSGDIQALAAFYQQHHEIKNWVYLLSGIDAVVRKIPFGEKEKRHIRKALGFILEDDCLHDADELHYISGKPMHGTIDVLAVSEQMLSQTLSVFEQQDILLTHCIAETQLLPSLEDEGVWQLYYDQGRYIVQIPHQASLTIEQQHLPLSLELLTAEYAELPEKIHLFISEQDEQADALSAIPDALKHLLDIAPWKKANTWQNSFNQQGKQWNLLQGAFARSKAWVGQIKPWRWLIALATVTVVLQLTLLAMDYRYEKQRHVDLRLQLDQEFRKAIPQGQIVDHKRQLERLFNSLQGGSQQQAFIAQLDNIGAILAEHKAGVINALNYEQDKREIRLDLLVDSYDQLEKVISAIKQLGFDVEIQNSNAQGEQLRARIRISQ